MLGHTRHALHNLTISMNSDNESVTAFRDTLPFLLNEPWCKDNDVNNFCRRFGYSCLEKIRTNTGEKLFSHDDGGDRNKERSCKFPRPSLIPIRGDNFWQIPYITSVM